jgi:ABC-type transporter Mla MlaB component
MMLRVTVHDDSESLIFRLEGRLAVGWVPALEDCWQNTPADAGKTVRFDLTQVTHVDSAGKTFLAARHAEGAELVASGCLMRAIVAEITNTGMPDY